VRTHRRCVGRHCTWCRICYLNIQEVVIFTFAVVFHLRFDSCDAHEIKTFVSTAVDCKIMDFGIVILPIFPPSKLQVSTSTTSLASLHSPAGIFPFGFCSRALPYFMNFDFPSPLCSMTGLDSLLQIFHSYHNNTLRQSSMSLRR